MKKKQIIVRITQKILDERSRFTSGTPAADALDAVLAVVSEIGAAEKLTYIDELEPGSHDRDALFIAQARAARQQAQG
jgi:hypothetical protein